MQWNRYIEAKTDWFKAITLPQPLADQVARGEVDHFVRRRSTRVRGQILIVSEPKGERGGMSIGFAKLTKVIKSGAQYVYFVEEAERVFEFPCQKCGAKSEIWDCFYTANTITPYPKINLRKWILPENLA